MKKQRFPQVSNACNLAIEQYIMQVMRYGDSFISQIPQYPIYEGENTLYTQMGTAEIGEQTNATHEVSAEEIAALHEVSGRGSIKNDDIRSVHLEALAEMLFNIAQGLQEGRGRTFYSELNSILHKAGRASNAKGEPFTFELWLQVLENMEFEFDEQGNPIWPTMVIPPAMEPAVKRVFQEADADAQKTQALRELLHRKREAFNAKEADRKLVD